MNSITEKHEIPQNTDYTSHLTRESLTTNMINYGRMKNHVMQLSFASQTTRVYLFHPQIESNHIRYKFEKRRCIHSVY